jgi:hypothetical protein
LSRFAQSASPLFLYAYLDSPPEEGVEGVMEGRPFPAIPCILCSKPLSLETDLYADENGKPVHEDCYVKQILTDRNKSARHCGGRLNSEYPSAC